SKLKNGSTGAGFVAYQAGLQVLKQAIPLGYNAEVFDAEAIGALAGLKAALQLETAKYAENLWVFLDNLEVATQLLGHTSSSSQAVFNEFYKLAPLWLARQRLAHIPIGAVQIKWVPGHTKIPGNEAADSMAKEGARMPLAKETPHTYASLKHWTKRTVSLANQKLWQVVSPEFYKELKITTSPLDPKELTLPRALLGTLL